MGTAKGSKPAKPHGKLKAKDPNNAMSVLSAQKREAYLDSLAMHGIVGQALEHAGGLSRAVLFYWREDSAFKEAEALAMAASVDVYRKEARRRALGYEKPVLYQGQPVYHIDPEKQAKLSKIYATNKKPTPDQTDTLMRGDLGEPIPVVEIIVHDRMLELMLKAHAPEHKERSEIEVKGGGGVLVVPATYTRDDWEKLEADRVQAMADEAAAKKK